MPLDRHFGTVHLALGAHEMTNETDRPLTAPYLVLSIVDAAGGHLEGRTKIQKLSYFISKTGSYPVEFGPHYYGPYSSEVDSALQTLVSFGLLEETVRTPNLSDPQTVVFEPKFYNYSLTEKGREVLENRFAKDDKERLRIRELVEKMRRTMNGLQTNTLSAAAKIDFILSNVKQK